MYNADGIFYSKYFIISFAILFTYLLYMRIVTLKSLYQIPNYLLCSSVTKFKEKTTASTYIV